MKGFIFVTIVLCIVLESFGGDLPPSIKKCPPADNICVRDKINEVLKLFPDGNAEFGLPKSSEITLENVTIARASKDSPIQLNFRYLRLTAVGLDKAVVKNTTGWTKQPSLIEADIQLPSLKISGDYETNGKILLLTLDGKGKGDVELIDNHVQIKAKIGLEKREDGKNYARVKKIRVILEPKKMIMRMENLVKGSQTLTDTLNDVLNENWKDVWTELSSGVNDVLSQCFDNSISSVFDKLSYDDFYAET